MKKILRQFAFVFAISAFGHMYGQTTLTGDHVIDGDLTVGTSANAAALHVVGDVGTAAQPSLSVSGEGGVIFEGILTNGVGNYLLWDPKSGRLSGGRGRPYPSQYEIENGPYSFAFGNGCTAWGEGAVAFGGAQVDGGYGFASGYSSGAYGGGAVAIGGSAQAYANNGVAIGNNPQVLGNESVAIGTDSQALEACSTAISGGIAVGERAVAFGLTVSSAYMATAIGRNNMYAVNAQSEARYEWRDEDPLFEIGNGTGISSDPVDKAYRNALTVYKSGKIIMERQGDILMGEFGNPE